MKSPSTMGAMIGSIGVALSQKMTSTFGHSRGPSKSQGKRVKAFSFSKYKPHQGVAEIARRKRQIDKGILQHA